VDVVPALNAWGGCARRAQLKGAVSRKALETAVRRGRVVKHGRTYALPVPEAALQVARELHGVASHRSAALQHGFALPPTEDPEAKGGHDVLLPPKARKLVVSTGPDPAHQVGRGRMAAAAAALGAGDVRAGLGPRDGPGHRGGSCGGQGPGPTPPRVAPQGRVTGLDRLSGPGGGRAARSAVPRKGPGQQKRGGPPLHKGTAPSSLSRRELLCATWRPGGRPQRSAHARTRHAPSRGGHATR